SNSQLSFSISTASSTSSTHTIQLVDPNKPLLFDDQVSQAEILWALKSVQNAFSDKNSDDVGLVVTRYYRTILLGHAQANVVVDGILGAFLTDGIDISKLLMLSRDNPNVNKTVEKMINDAMKKVNAELLNVGTCNLHVIHNGFKAGTTETNWHVENFCLNIWSWFQKSPVRQEDFENITDELNDAIEKTILYFSNLHVLDPASRTKQDSADTMIRVGRAIPKLLSNAEIDRIRHEFMMCAVETIDQSWYIKNKYHDSDGVGSPHRVPIKIDMIRAVQKSKLVYNQEQLSLKSLADRKKEQSEKHEHTNEEMKKLIDRENQLLSKQKGLHDKKRKHNCWWVKVDNGLIML
ncbi:unnamed protein product, partial [Rotaria magnacalcarata]